MTRFEKTANLQCMHNSDNSTFVIKCEGKIAMQAPEKRFCISLFDEVIL